MGQAAERRQRPGIEVDPVDVQFVRAVGAAEVESDRGQGGGRARPGAADDRQVAVGRLPSAGELPLPDRVVHQPGRGPARAGRFGEARRGDLAGEGRRPRRAGLGTPEAVMG